MSWLDTLEEIRKRDWSEAPAAEREAKARDVVDMSAYAGALVAVVPIPLADFALLLPVHTAMVMTVGHIYGRKLDEAEAKRVVLELGAIAGFAAVGHLAISFLKRTFLPVVGGLLSVSASFALTWAMGRVAMAYFQDPAKSREDLKKVFEDAIAEGRSAFSKDAFDKFKARYEAAKAKVEGKEPEEVKAPEPEVRTAEPAAPPPPAEPRAPRADDPYPRKKRTL